MITNNFRLFLQSVCAAGSDALYKIINGSTTQYSSSAVLNYNRVKIILGSGDNTPAVTDYTLETPINNLTELSHATSPSSSGAISSFDNATSGIVTTTTFKNNTASDITVNELGVVGGTSSNALLIREVLDTPVVIEPNQSYSFTVTIG